MLETYLMLLLISTGTKVYLNGGIFGSKKTSRRSQGRCGDGFKSDSPRSQVKGFNTGAAGSRETTLLREKR